MENRKEERIGGVNRRRRRRKRKSMEQEWLDEAVRHHRVFQVLRWPPSSLFPLSLPPSPFPLPQLTCWPGVMAPQGV